MYLSLLSILNSSSMSRSMCRTTRRSKPKVRAKVVGKPRSIIESLKASDGCALRANRYSHEKRRSRMFQEPSGGSCSPTGYRFGFGSPTRLVRFGLEGFASGSGVVDVDGA